MPLAAITPAVAALVGGGAAAGASVYGARRAGQSQDRAARYTADADRAAMEEARLQREEDARRWAVEQEFQRQQWQAQEEERAYNRRLHEEREARQAPYRQASQAALGNLGQMLGLDLSGSPLAQNLSAPRSAPTDSAPPMMRNPRDIPGADWRAQPVPQGAMPSMGMTAQPAMGPNPVIPSTLGDLTGLRRRTPRRY